MIQNSIEIHCGSFIVDSAGVFLCAKKGSCQEQPLVFPSPSASMAQIKKYI